MEKWKELEEAYTRKWTIYGKTKTYSILIRINANKSNK